MLERQPDAHSAARARLGHHFDAASQGFGARSHAGDAVAAEASIWRLGGVDAPAVVFDDEDDFAVHLSDPIVNAQLPSTKSSKPEPEPTGINFVDLLIQKKSEEK